MNQGSIPEVRSVARMVDMRFALGVACTLLLGIPLATSATRADAPEGGFGEGGAPGHAAAVELGRPFTQATLTAPVGTPFEFAVDWTTGQVSLAPHVLGSVELPGPDAGCAVSATGAVAVGWIVEPPGIYAQGDCDQQVFFNWPISRSALVCVVGVGAGNCGMEGVGFRHGSFGKFNLVCLDGSGVVLYRFTSPLLGTMNCNIFFLGEFPHFWDLWSGRVGNVPGSPGDPNLSWGLNWRFES